MASTKPPARSKIRADTCCTLYFPDENPWIYLPLIYLRIFFHLIVNDTWKQQTTALEDLLAIMCLMQTGIPWWNGVAVFFINKKMASPKRSLLTKIQLHICRILYPPDDNLWAQLPLIRSKMLLPFDHRQYVEADKRQLHSKLARHYFFHKNQHLKYQAFPKAGWQHNQ